MSYLAFDLDALKMVPDCARSSGLSEAELGYGLVRLWSYCWTVKTDRVKPAHLGGFFGGPDRSALICALIAFEFLEGDAEGNYRVRGADRYLRITDAQSRGGKRAKNNLRRGTSKPEVEPGTSPGCLPGVAGEQPEVSRESAPALTPNTEHRTPSSELTAAAAVAEKVINELLEKPPPVVRSALPPAPERVPIVVTPPTSEPELWTGDDFWRWAQHKRQQAGFIAEHPPPGLSAWWSTWLSTLNGDTRRMQEAFYAFGDAKYWQREQLPFRAFMKQTDQFVPRKAVIRAVS